jgi:uncharacterized membrane protein
MIKKYFFYFMPLLYMTAGVFHFVIPSVYLRIMPPYLPYHSELIYISGVLEILFGILLIPSKTRRFAAWFIIFLLIGVFPANIQMSLNYWQSGNPHFWISILRLPIQFVLIYWA